MNPLTADLIISWRPCWPADRVRAACAPLGATFTALDVLRLDAVPAADRLWVVLREEVLDARTLRLFAARAARRALEGERCAGREPDARSWAAVEVAERYARGDATEAERAAARDAAADSAAWFAARAARAAAWSAARGAATSAARAARSAAWSAAAAAADAAAWCAAWSAAWSAAECEAQVRDLIDLLGGK